MTASEVVVVGAAVIREGRVLAARRTHPPQAARRWEFPGGKVELGETIDEAIRRELLEELGSRIRVTGVLAGSVPIKARYVLRVATAVLVEGEPIPREHDAIRWLGAEQLGEVDWLEPDRPFLAELATLLRPRPAS